MTMDDTDDEIQREPLKERLTWWVVWAVFCTFVSNVFAAFETFWCELSGVLAAHGNYKNNKRTFADSVMADISKL